MSSTTMSPDTNVVIDGQPSGAGMDMKLWVAHRVRIRRLLLGMSREQFAREVGVSTNQTRKYERGEDQLGPDRLWRVAQVLGVDVGWFFAGKDDEEYGGLKIGAADMEIAKSTWALALAVDMSKLPDWQREFIEACVARFKRANSADE